MAFVTIENKDASQELIIFPNLYETVGGKLVQDNVIKVSGRVNAKDKNGNSTDEIKIIADTIEVITDEMLENYQATGAKLPALSKATPRRQFKNSAERVAEAKPTKSTPIPPPVSYERIFVLIKDPSDAELLSRIRKLCDDNLGRQEIILVTKEGDEKRPIRLPFKINLESDLPKKLEELLGKDCVKLK